VYTRFPTKEHVLLYLARDMARELEVDVSRALGPAARGLRTPLQVSERYFGIAAEAFARRRSVLRPLTLLTRMERQNALQAIVQQFNRRALTMLRDRLLVFRAQVRHPKPETAIQTAIGAASAMLRETLLYGDVVPVGARSRAAGRVAAQLCVAYLCWAPRTAVRPMPLR
jgi:hypothetical protein